MANFILYLCIGFGVGVLFTSFLGLRKALAATFSDDD